MTYASSSLAPTSAPAVGQNGTVQWTIGTLAANTTASFTLTVNVPSTITGSTKTNTATLQNSYTPDVTASATVTIASPNVLIAKTASGNNFFANDTFSYTINAVNAGNAAASSVVVSDPIPSYFTVQNYTSSTNTVGVINITNGGSGYTATPAVIIAPPTAGTTATATAALVAVTVSGNNLTFNVGSLAIGGTATFVITVKVNNTGLPAGNNQIPNTATVVDAYNTAQRTATATVTINANPNLVLSETATASATRLVYVNVTNGDRKSTPPTATVSGCTISNPVVEVSTSPAAGLSSATYSVTGVTVISPGEGCTGPMLVNFSGSGGATATAVTGPASGDQITYVIKLQNTGAADATNCVINGSVPA